MEKFTLAIKFTANSNNKLQFKQELINLFNIIKEEENFIDARIHQNMHKPEEFLVYENWRGTFESFLNNELKRPAVLEWEKLLVNLNIQREPSVYEVFGEF